MTARRSVRTTTDRVHCLCFFSSNRPGGRVPPHGVRPRFVRRQGERTTRDREIVVVFSTVYGCQREHPGRRRHESLAFRVFSRFRSARRENDFDAVFFLHSSASKQPRAIEKTTQPWYRGERDISTDVHANATRRSISWTLHSQLIRS